MYNLEPQQVREMLRKMLLRIAHGFNLSLGKNDAFSVELHWRDTYNDGTFQLDKFVFHRKGKKPYEHDRYGNTYTQELIGVFVAPANGETQTLKFEAKT